MTKKTQYSIGETSKICNISKKTLRFYDEIGLVPSQRSRLNNYRYYSHDSLLMIPVLKYYKQMGFKLNELADFIRGDVPNAYPTIKECFRKKIDEISFEQEALRIQKVAVDDWYELLSEAELVINNQLTEVSAKYVPNSTLLFQDQESNGQLKSDIINIQWNNYVEEIHNAITGPVIIQYHSMQDRMNDEPKQNIRILQKNILPAKEKETVNFGDTLMASCYHIGSHEHISEIYRRIIDWAKRRGYTLGAECYERYVIDYWTSCNTSQYVTEVLVKISRENI